MTQERERHVCKKCGEVAKLRYDVGTRGPLTICCKADFYSLGGGYKGAFEDDDGKGDYERDRRDGA